MICVGIGIVGLGRFRVLNASLIFVLFVRD